MSGATLVDCTRRAPAVCALLVACASQHPTPRSTGDQATAPATGAATHAKPGAGVESLTVPIRSIALDNGLRVVMSRDPTAPVVTIAVYYGIGFRIEPRDRTGFAHLFEHMMFQGSQNLGKMEFIKMVQANGGVLNGSTRFDFTNYFEVVPANTLEAMLWGEADRMRGLAVTQDNLTNQQGVVKSEVRVNVLNRPYGGFPWLDMPQYANKNWHNAHNFYGDLTDLDQATLTDVQNFFKQYYTPNNAVLVIAGDFDEVQAEAWVRKYFAAIPRGPQPARPDLAEPRQDQEIKAEKVDPLAERPALAVAYHVPDRNTPEFYAFTMLHEILLEGRDSALYQKLVQDKRLVGEIEGGINLLGNPFDYAGPMLWIVNAAHDKTTPPEQLVAAIDEVIEPIRRQPVSDSVLARARVKARAQLYGMIEQFFGFGRADLLASFVLFDNDPSRINQIEGELMKVTPELIQKTAREYLRPTNRTILKIKTAK